MVVSGWVWALPVPSGGCFVGAPLGAAPDEAGGVALAAGAGVLALAFALALLRSSSAS